MTGDIHVIPVDDLHEHIIGAECPCEPTVEVEGAILIYIHNSWDCREAVEWAEELLHLQPQ